MMSDCFMQLFGYDSGIVGMPTAATLFFYPGS